jgi:hypothetical protein
MGTLVDRKYVGPQNNKDIEIVRVVWDFAVDGGEVEDNVVLTATGACVVKLNHVNVLTAVLATGGACAMSLGKGTGGVEFMSAVAKTTLVLDYVVGSTGVVKLAAADTISMRTATNAATAGKLEFVFEVYAA